MLRPANPFPTFPFNNSTLIALSPGRWCPQRLCYHL